MSSPLSYVCVSVVCVVVLGSRLSHAQVDPFQPDIPKSQVKLLEQARTERLDNHTTEAIEHLKQLVAENPQFYSAYYGLGLSYYRAGRVKEAIGALQKAVDIKEASTTKPIKDTTIYNTLGWVCLVAGQYSKSEEYLKKAASHEGENDASANRRIFNNLGLLYLYRGDFPKSKTYLEKAKGLGSGTAEINLQLLDNAKRAVKSPAPQVTAAQAQQAPQKAQPIGQTQPIQQTTASQTNLANPTNTANPTKQTQPTPQTQQTRPN
jgi:Flp pilus assembly protein TadD